MNALAVVFVFLIAIFSIAAVKTAIPNSNASKPCLLGYRATCSFTPISTAICISAAVILFVAAKRMTLI
jgi:hypothetical protein